MTLKRSFAGTAWVLPAALALHVAEEAPSFAAWARRNTWTGYTNATSCASTRPASA